MFDPAKDLGTPETIEQAITERNNWCGTAAQHLRNTQHYQQQRDAFLREALVNPEIAAAAERIVGEGWRNLLDDKNERLPEGA
jgi:hypothetical protein